MREVSNVSGFIVAPGEVIKEYLDSRGLTQKEVSKRIGVSERHLSKMLNGKTRLTEEMALKLEKLMPDVPASFWLNYEVKYQEYLAREKEEHELEGLDLKAISQRFHFREALGMGGRPLVEQAISMLKLLGVSKFDRYRYAIPGGIEFMQDGGEDEAVVVWLKLCEEEVAEQNDVEGSPEYSEDALRSVLPMLKDVASNTDFFASLKSCRMLLNSVGVYLVYHEAIGNAKVRGALTSYEGHPTIYISGRYKTHGDAWFAICHELGHLLDGFDLKKTGVSMEDTDELKSEDEADIRANAYARKFFVDSAAYGQFVSDDSFSSANIKEFAAGQGVAPGIIVAFLQHDRHIGFNEFNYIKDRF